MGSLGRVADSDGGGGGGSADGGRRGRLGLRKGMGEGFWLGNGEVKVWG